jgi:spermidine/putrescine transport system ATP-binding protein
MATLEPGTGTDPAQPAQPDAAGDPTVRLERVSKHFGELVAVKELDLDIGRGEFFTMLGPSGCGKTTTLRMVAGFEQPTAGRVLIEGSDVAGLPSYKRPTNTVFQSYALFPHLSVRDNVAFGLRRKKVAKGEIAQRVEAELGRVGLAAEINRRPNQLSGGQQQRVALARALVNLPKVLLLDEPLGALDLKLRKELQLELKGIQRDVGITFVYVTHDQEEALTMSDRIAVMSNGVVEQVDTPENVYERPATTFVAGFIGVSNLMPGTVTSATGGRGMVRLDTGLEVESRVDGLATGERCHAVVRPEKLRISPAASSAARPEAAGSDEGPRPGALPGVHGVVQSSVYLGTSTQIIVALPGDVSMTVLVPNASEAERARLPGGGAPVRLSWEADHMHVVRESESRPADVEETVLA